MLLFGIVNCHGRQSKNAAPVCGAFMFDTCYKLDRQGGEKRFSWRFVSINLSRGLSASIWTAFVCMRGVTYTRILTVIWVQPYRERRSWERVMGGGGITMLAKDWNVLSYLPVLSVLWTSGQAWNLSINLESDVHESAFETGDLEQRRQELVQ